MAESIRDKVLRVLKERGLLDEKRLKAVLEEAKKNEEGSILDMLTEKDIVSEQDLLKVLSRELSLPAIDITRVTLDKEVVSLVSEKLTRRHSIIPLSKIGDSLTLIVSDPTDVVAIDDVKTVTGCDVELVLATRQSIQDVLRKFYDKGEEDLYSALDDDEGDADVEVIGKIEGSDTADITSTAKTAPIVKMVDLVISESIKKRASDIHIEPQEKSLRIRYRIDGELHNVFDLPKKNQNAMLARIKIMSGMDITETRVPQDGRFRVKLEGKEIDFRVSALPTNAGNKIVMRALDKSNLSVGLETLGFLPEPLADFQEALARPFGIILVTGPTGSGKSTTLYSVLNEMNSPERNIITIEDPVEYQVAGITQVAARPEIGLTFSSGLRAMLRQSPDIIMVGEIRDFETADIAIKASLTGQMVLSTLHTNDSVGAITRLVNMGIDPFLVASSLVMACAQRLLRKICPNCKDEEKIPEDTLKMLRETYPEAEGVTKFLKGKGCSQCSDTGYR